VSSDDQRPVLYRATHEAVESSRGPDRPLRRYAYVLVELNGMSEPFEGLAEAVDDVAGCTSLSVCIPPLRSPAEVAEGWVEAIVDAHEIDEEDARTEKTIAHAIKALTALIQAPRSSL
jgi:hypothetical protein